MKHLRRSGGGASIAVARLMLVAVMVVALLSAGLGTMGIAAGDGEAEHTFQSAPLNPDFVDYMENPPESFYGYIPPPIVLNVEEGLAPEVGLPASYDWRDSGMVTSVKNQSTCGTCWIFGATSTLESKVLIDESASYDFSEQSVALCVDRSWDYLYDGASDPCQAGGWGWLAGEAFIKKGAVLDSCNPYNTGALYCDGACVCDSCTPVKKVDGYRLVTNDGSQIETIKNAILNEGPMTLVFYYDGGAEYCDPTYGAIYDYYPCSGENNHLISVIGWDDDVPHPNPSHTGAGAWLVKNSWGTADKWAGEKCVSDGYFYLAYGSSCVQEIAYFEYKDHDPSESLLYWDEAGMVDAIGCGTGGTPDAWMANVYTTGSAGDLTHVDFYTTSSNASYEIYVWDGYFGTQLRYQTGSCAEPGYYSIPLSSPLPLGAGAQFTLGVYMNTPGYGWPIPIEGLSPYANPPIQSGVSFIKCAAADLWEDTADYGWNACLRARMSVEAVEAPDIWVDPTEFDVTLPPDDSWTGYLDIHNDGSGTLTYSITDGQTTPPVSIPASDGNFPRGSAPDSTGPAPVAATQTEEPAPAGVGGGSGEPAFAIDIYPDENLVYIPDTTVPGTWNIVGSVAGTAYFAGDFLLGDFSQMYVIDYSTNTLYTLDTTTATSTAIGACTPVSGQSWTGMTGATDGTLYASSSDVATSYLYTINPGTGAATVVGQITNAPCIIDIAINAAGEMYGVDIVDDVLVRINPSTGSGTVVGSIGFSANNAQGMDFEEVSGVLYLAAYNSSTFVGELRIADTSSGNTLLVGGFPGGAETDCLGFTTFPAEPCPWLDENPKAGDVPPASFDPIEVNINTTGLADGDYYCEIVISNNDPDENPTIVPVHLTVVCPPDIRVDPTEFNVTLPPDDSWTGYLDIHNDGCGTLDYSISDTETTAPAGSGPGELEFIYQEEVAVSADEVNASGMTTGLKAAYTWEGPPGNGPAILVYTDDAFMLAGNTYVEQALQALGLSYTAYYGDYDGFGAALTTGGPWDLVLVSHNNWFELGNWWTEIEDYVDGGGTVVIETFDIDGSNSEATTLWATLGVSYASDMSTAAPVYRWQPTHPIFTAVESVPDMTTLTEYYGDDGDKCDPVSPTIAVAGFTASETAGQGALFTGSTVNSFIISQFRGDDDSDGKLDAVELWKNEISHALAPAPDCPWLDENPKLGDVPPASFDPIEVNINTTGLADGDYYCEIVISNNDPDENPTIVPVHLTVVCPPDIRVDPTHFNVTLPPDDSWTGYLDICNDGCGTLDYNIADIETTGGPWFEWVAQDPDPVPGGEMWLLKAKVHDPDGLGDIDYVRFLAIVEGTYYYLNDGGTGGDEVAGDGIYSGTFYGATTFGAETGLMLEAKDTAGNTGSTTFTYHVLVAAGGAADGMGFTGSLPEEATPSAVGPSKQVGGGGDGVSTEQTRETAPVAPSYDPQAPSQVAVFMDSNPWGYTAIQDILTAQGISYDVYNSGQMGSVDLSPYDKVITASVQGNTFWNALEANKAWFESYVSAGGVLEMHLCAQISGNSAGKVYPGGFVFYYTGSNDVSIVDPAHPVLNTPNTIADADLDGWSYSVHGWFTAIPAGGSVVLTETGSGEPVWAEGGLGLGTIFATTQTVEFRAGNYDKPEFLENMILYMPAPGCPWLDENPKSGDVPPKSCDQIGVTIDTTGMACGDYSAEIWIASNDPNENPTIVPVHLTVVCGGICGDVNCSGAVDIFDVIDLLYYVGYPGQYKICSEWAADVNCSGGIDIFDVIDLLYFVGYPGQYKLNCCPPK